MLWMLQTCKWGTQEGLSQYVCKICIIKYLPLCHMSESAVESPISTGSSTSTDSTGSTSMASTFGLAEGKRSLSTTHTSFKLYCESDRQGGWSDRQGGSLSRSTGCSTSYISPQSPGFGCRRLWYVQKELNSITRWHSSLHSMSPHDTEIMERY